MKILDEEEEGTRGHRRGHGLVAALQLRHERSQPHGEVPHSPPLTGLHPRGHLLLSGQ